jgi:serine/threonine-protein kinase
MAGTVAGTLAFLAPELVRGGQASAASDTYALGVVAFQALTGRLPRPSGSMEEFVATIRGPATIASAAAPHLGDAFDGPIAAALATDPRSRQDPLGLAADLVAALGRWRRSGGPARQPAPAVLPAAAAGLPPPGATVDTEANTVLIRPPADDRRRARQSLVLPGAAVAGVAIALAYLLGAFGSIVPDRTGTGDASANPSGSGSADAGATASPTEEPTPTPTAEPTPTPTPEPSPTPTPNPLQPAFDALGDVRRAIDVARNEGNLRQRDANDLRRVADEVEAALRSGDFERAWDRAKRLLDQIDEFDELSDEFHDPMLDAAAALEVETKAHAEGTGS